jgi:Zn-dependent protease
MFRRAFRLPFKLMGIPVELDVSFLVILPVLAWMISTNLGAISEQLHIGIDADALGQTTAAFLLGLAAALGLFVSIVVHELGHAMVGRRLGFEVKVITLWLLGGMAQFEKMPKRGGAEAIMAIAGPVTSYALAGVFWLVLTVTPASAAPAWKFLSGYLMGMNVLLATFNLVPALPLDGGRVLRSLLALRMDYLKATLAAAGASKVLAFSMALLGILSGNIWLIFIAFFVFMAVTGETQMAMFSEMLRGIEVRDLMTSDVKTVSPETKVPDILGRMLADGHLGYPVVDASKRLVGMLTLGNIKSEALERKEPAVTASEVMSTDVKTITAADSAYDAFQKITQGTSGRLMVVGADGHVEGIISKSDLVRAVQVRTVGEALGYVRHQEPASPAGSSAR